MSTASTKGQHCLLKVKNRPKENIFKRKGWVLGGDRKRPRSLWGSRETAKGFIQHKQASSFSGSGKGNTSELEGSQEPKPIKQEKWD